MRETGQRVERTLIVEDDARLRATLVSALEGWSAEVRGCATMREGAAAAAAWRPQLLLLDYKLPDGTAVALLEGLPVAAPRPTVVVMSAFAQPAESFALAQLGARAYLQKPIDLPALAGALEKALADHPDVPTMARDVVGVVGLRQMESEVRRAMVSEALERADGNRRGAARLLGVSRQLLQHTLRK